MENCGRYKNKENGEISSTSAIVLHDTHTVSDQFLKDELDLSTHLESIADTNLRFGVEQTNLILRRKMPQLDIKLDKANPPHKEEKRLTEVARRLLSLRMDQYENIQESFYLRQQLKVQADPWENYFMHDAQYFLPLICHEETLAVEK